jgi:hypothetical protein
MNEEIYILNIQSDYISRGDGPPSLSRYIFLTKIRNESIR